MTLPSKLQAARLLLVRERPYLAAAVWALQPVVKPGLQTLGVDMYWRLYYDPEIFHKWTAEVISGVLYHEICHLLRDHAERMKNCDPKISNIATDAEINDDLLREKVKLPSLAVTPASIGQPDNLLAEQYYAALENQQRKSSTPKPGAESAGSSNQRNDISYASDPTDNCSVGQDCNPKVSSVSETHLTNDELNQQYEQECYYHHPANVSPDPEKGKDDGEGYQGWPQSGFQPEDVPSPGAGRCGSCATGQPEPWEDSASSQSSQSGLSKTEAELIRRDVANQIREDSRGQGLVPGHWLRWADAKLHPRVDWRQQLAGAVRLAMADTNGAADYSYHRPSRRQGQAGQGDIIFPSLRYPVPSIAIIVDTSGSISEGMLAQTLAEISSILRILGQKQGIYVIAVDQAVHSCRRVFGPEQITLTGGGGTDMGAGLAAAAELKPLPQVGIVITDGKTPWPEMSPRGMKVIVVLSGEGTAPQWARVIKITA